MNLSIDDRLIPLDKEGYLKNWQDWQPEAAGKLAERENILLTDAHWEVIKLLRDFYREYQLSPAMRALVKYIEQKLGPEKGRSIYLQQLFPPSPARTASKIAGLPKPANCL